ncbi:MAG TPA: transglutaminase-like domain-containing protein [Phycisphaerae bacterium]|nr:transglutaminase-like domain-containing protein [Phycisphaerae bacterium]
MEMEPASGASVFWTVVDERVHRARELVNGGGLGAAEALLAATEDGGGPELKRACREGKEIIRRIRLDYSLSPEELLDRVRKVLPDASTGDIERWREAGQVLHRVLDGRTCYWQREPANLWKLCEEAGWRRAVVEGCDPNTPAPLSAGERKLIEQLQKVVEEARRTGKAEVVPVRHTIRYTLTVNPSRPGARTDSIVRCWLAFPQEYRGQHEVRLLRTDPAGHVIAPAAGTCSGDCAHQRTIYLERKIDDPGRPVRFFAEYEYLSHAYYPDLDDRKVRPATGDDLRVYLEERPPHIRFTPEIRAEVERIVAGESNPLARARLIFRWFSGNVRYAYEEEYSTIPSFCEKVFRLRWGDCGVQSVLFITMCRLAGVPARWQSGWVTFPDNWNMHDWAEIYVEPWGWLPVDVSYGTKPSDDPAVREFYFGHLDSYRLISNLDYGCPLTPAKRDLRSETADFQRGEVEIDGRNLYFDEWEYDFNFVVAPLDGGMEELNHKATKTRR